MIVKNESHVIVETLENLCSYINFSYWVISDTGSTDNTKEVITSFFLAKNIPGEIVEHEWRDFGYNRSKALECAYNKTDYLLIFDADDRLIGDFKLPAVYDKDQYQLLFGTNFVYTRPLLINNRKKWCFKGVLHESLSSMEEVKGVSILEGNYHVISGRTGARSQNPNKYIDDANILKKAHFSELKTDYNLSCRYAFYCAQSYKDAGVNYYDDAIEWYKKCLELKMWVQEKFYGCLNIGLIYSYKKDYMNALKYWYKTIEYDPERIEGIIHAMNYLRNDGQHIIINALYHKFKNYNKNLEGKLFLFKNVYNDELEYHNTISAFYVHDKKSGYECCKTIILNNTISPTLLKSTISNMQFYIDFLKDDFKDDFDCASTSTTNINALKMFYVVDKIMGDMCCKNEHVETNMMNIWNILFEKCRPLLTSYNNNYSFTEYSTSVPYSGSATTPSVPLHPLNRDNPEIIISFTTCKRLELFKQTIHSILNHWLDVDKIDYWFCVDDNSCEEDRNNMKTLYPWIDYYMKNTEEKGHKQSMNIIWDKLNELKPTYWIHMEDDFLFHTKMNYIEEAIRGLRSSSCVDSQVKQILFNKSYGETIEQYNSGGHVVNNSSNSIIVHDFKIGVFPYQNCHYWPHYSFRPSLTDVKTILELGNFETEDTFFEMTYAKKWTNAGYKTGFFNKITNRHIGRLTINRGDKTSPNAYELNSEAQFYKPLVPVVPEPSIKIINLERRLDRKAATIKKLSDVGINETQYEFIKAVDGIALEPTIELKRVFDGNDFQNRKGFIGCALSHYDLWKRLLADEKNEYYVIMEDDFSLCSHFKQKFMSLLPVFKEKEMLFMGYHMFEKNRQKVLDIYVDDPSSELLRLPARCGVTTEFNHSPTARSKIIKVEPLNKNLYIGGYFMYSINKKGAQICVDYIQKNGIKHGIDYIVKIMPNLSCFETQPHMAFSIWNEHGVPIDSDIQNIGDCFDFSKIENLSTDADADAVSQHDIHNKYMFIPNVDQYGCDIYYHKNTLQTYFEIAEKDEACVAFNTLGFFKNFVDLQKMCASTYFKKGDGIYIKKKYYDSLVLANKSMCDSSDISDSSDSSVIRIKMLCNWTKSENLCKEWSNMCDDPSNFRWKNYQLVWSDNKDEIDYYVIINSPPQDAYFDPLKMIVFQMEPWVNDPTKNWGVKTWGQWAEPDPAKFLAVRGRKTAHHNNALWQLELTYNELLKLEIIKQPTSQHTISSICSSKYFDEGHIARIDLLKYIEQKNDPNVQIDIYNADNKHNFTNYKGPVSPYVDKSKGMLSYKYYFMMENNYEENFITEKIWEPILCESLVFYYGCPNVTDYIDARAFVLLDPNDFEKSYQIIKQAIEEDWWSQRIDIIRQEKRKILNELSFFPTIDKILMRCNNNITIIVARYNENVTWSKQFDNVIIYNKGEKLEDGYNEILLENVGREAHTYYKYIYDNYDNLDDYTIFLQGNPFDHSPNIINKIRAYKMHPSLHVDFKFLSETISECTLYKCPHHFELRPIEVYEKIFGYKKENMNFKFGNGAQFIVSKQKILSNPKEFYLKIINLLNYTINPIEGYSIERLHSLFFCNINKKKNNFTHFRITGNERQIGVKNLLQKCAHKYYNPRIYDIPFNTHDRGNENELAKEYSMCYNKNNPNLEKYCGPDWIFYSWPSTSIFAFEDTKNEIIIEANKPPLLDKIGWYGNIYSPLPDVIENKTRPLLKKIGDEHHDLFDILHILPNNNGVINTLCANYLSLTDLIKYKYLIDIGGNGFSGRLKYLLFSKRPLLLVDRIYIEYFYNDLIPYVHYIPVNMNLSNLLEQVEWMKLNDDKCTELANNAFEFAMNHFTEDKLLERVHYVYQNIY